MATCIVAPTGKASLGRPDAHQNFLSEGNPVGREQREHEDSGSCTTPEPDEHAIRMRAYAIWEEEGRPEGRALDHWLRARWELEPAPDPEAELKRLERDLGPGLKTV
jgi:hypothetical protein